MALEPVVNRLESSMSDTVNFIKINVKDHVADELSKQLDLEVTPTFIFFGRDGIEQWRSVGHLDPRRVKKSMLA
jgi:thioredoxin-related protein|tara:strand:+ start:991 stop:1212 length:222 start_codon:yes stop_codon:yes gene_type:complete